MGHYDKILKGLHGHYQVVNHGSMEGGSAPKVRTTALSNNKKIDFIEKIEIFCATTESIAVKEKISLDLYSLVSNTPSSRLGLRTRPEMRELMNQIGKTNVLFNSAQDNENYLEHYMPN